MALCWSGQLALFEGDPRGRGLRAFHLHWRWRHVLCRDWEGGVLVHRSETFAGCGSRLLGWIPGSGKAGSAVKSSA